MRNTRRLGTAVAVIAMAILTVAVSGCSKQASLIAQQRTLSNPSDFPLYQPSKVVDVAPFDQRVMAHAINTTMKSGDRKLTPYKGNEVVASTEATLSALKRWLDKTKKAPPVGLKLSGSIAEGNTTEQVKILKSWGAELAGFSGANDRSVLVMIMDPKTVNERIGPALDLIDKYQALPAMIRTPIDRQAKTNFGFSVSEMLDKNSPVGVFISAVQDLKSSGRRAIVLLDATKD